MANGNFTYRVALFDLDGTLIDSTEAIVESTVAALEELGWPAIGRDVIVRHIGYKLEAAFPERAPEERRHLIEVIGRHYTRVCAEKTVLHPGIGPLLDRLAGRGVPMGIVTSKRRDHTEQILAALNVRTHFGAVVGYEDVRRMKPNPEGVHLAMDRLAARPEDCLYVGDTRVDIETARSAGVRIAGVEWGTDGLAALRVHGLDHEFKSPDAIDPLFPGA